MQGDLTALIKRVEKATGPDRELDAEIYVALSPTISATEDIIYFKVPMKHDQCAPGTYWRVSRSGASLHTAATYTASFEIALDLLMETLPRPWCRDFDGSFALRHGYIQPPLANDALTCIASLLRTLQSQQADRSSYPAEGDG